MPATATNHDQLVISYLTLRKAIGIIGIALPFVVAGGHLLFGRADLLASISDSYHTIMGDVFVGALCAIGVFLFTYRGYDWRDDLSGDACVFALGTAFAPVAPAEASEVQRMVGYGHYIFASAFFLILAWFCLGLFPKSDPSQPMTAAKRRRNHVYRICGWSMLGCIALIALYFAFLTSTAVARLRPIFWLETIAILCFGVSWFVKGQGILEDPSGSDGSASDSRH